MAVSQKIAILLLIGVIVAGMLIHFTGETKKLPRPFVTSLAATQPEESACLKMDSLAARLKAHHGPLFNLSDEVIASAQQIAMWSFARAVNLSNWARAFSAYRPMGTLRLLQLGGSMPLGRDCVDTVSKVSGEKCAYAARVGDALRSMFPAADVEVLNKAKSGFDIKVALHSISGMFHNEELRRREDLQPNIILADFTVNDILQREDKAHIGSLYEEFFARIRDVAPRSALLVILSPALLHSAAFDDFAAQIAAACVFHGVALLDLRMAARRTSWQPWGPSLSREAVRRMMKEYQWTEESAEIALRSTHPPWIVHAAIADMVSAAIARLYLLSGCGGPKKPPLHDPSSSHLFLKSPVSCAQPTTVISAGKRASTTSISVPPGSWKLSTDERGRVGWATGQVGANITFPVTFGLRRPLMLSVVYLRSHTAVGDAKLFCGKWQEQPALLAGRWDRRISTPFVETFWADLTDGESSQPGGMFGFNAQPGSTVNLTLEFAGPAGTFFRLLEVIAC